ncbi:uncharacterized protein LOC130719536 [Lotus japonicus]|uniref:uncharacterized protein LOC130719536 n=1 Tax=Lotus japonicus TaxID=34305 RepID=UPI002589A869|nr:uncharacterized protein LOC130719536 [Lotus japonicus]
MSQSSGKNDSVKEKIERIAKGVKCMGLKSGSSQPSSVSKKAPGKTKTRNPARKTYMSKVQNKEPTNVPHYEDVSDEEEINDEDSPVKSSPDVVLDVETSRSKEIYDQENLGKDSLLMKTQDADPKNGNSEDTNSEEPTQAPAPVQDISDDDSDDVPLAKSIPDSVVTPTPPKRSKSSPVTYKSRQATVKGKGKQKLVREFLVNLSVDVGLPESDEFRKVFVMAECAVFSLAIINQALGRSAIEFADEDVSMDAIAKELTAGHVKKWPHKKLLSTGNLSVKYAILNRIGAQTLKYADTCDVELPGDHSQPASSDTQG